MRSITSCFIAGAMWLSFVGAPPVLASEPEDWGKPNGHWLQFFPRTALGCSIPAKSMQSPLEPGAAFPDLRSVVGMSGERTGWGGEVDMNLPFASNQGSLKAPPGSTGPAPNCADNLWLNHRSSDAPPADDKREGEGRDNPREFKADWPALGPPVGGQGAIRNAANALTPLPEKSV